MRIEVTEPQDTLMIESLQTSSTQDDDSSSQEEEEEEFSQDDVSSESLSWIKWFCSRPENQILIQIPVEYIEDSFNLTNLDAIIPNIEDALNVILDYEVAPDFYQQAELNSRALYGLIHARYILSKQGLNDAYSRFADAEYGICPRALCEAASLLPIGLSDKLLEDTVKMYCPRCSDIYQPHPKFCELDGAYFGRTFAHLFEFTFQEQLANRFKGKEMRIYQPKIYGFVVNKSSLVGEKCRWLREL